MEGLVLHILPLCASQRAPHCLKPQWRESSTGVVTNERSAFGTRSRPAVRAATTATPSAPAFLALTACAGSVGAKIGVRARSRLLGDHRRGRRACCFPGRRRRTPTGATAPALGPTPAVPATAPLGAGAFGRSRGSHGGLLLPLLLLLLLRQLLLRQLLLLRRLLLMPLLRLLRLLPRIHVEALHCMTKVGAHVPRGRALRRDGTCTHAAAFAREPRGHFLLRFGEQLEQERCNAPVAVLGIVPRDKERGREASMSSSPCAANSVHVAVKVICARAESAMGRARARCQRAARRSQDDNGADASRDHAHVRACARASSRDSPAAVGRSKLTTCATPETSMPRAATSVATSTGLAPDLKAASADSRWL